MNSKQANECNGLATSDIKGVKRSAVVACRSQLFLEARGAFAYIIDTQVVRQQPRHITFSTARRGTKGEFPFTSPRRYTTVKAD